MSRRPATPACSMSGSHLSRAAPCKPDEEAYYDIPNRSEETGTLYEHCLRAIRARTAVWRARPAADGLRRLERRHEPGRQQGKGESVWLAFFLYDVLRQFAEIARNRGDHGHGR